MAINVLMPKLSFIVTQGTILEWLKEPGDSVDKGEPLLVIESEKATVDVEAPGTGILGPNLAPVGTTVPVTTTIGYLLEPGEECPELELDLEEGAADPADVDADADADADRRRSGGRSGATSTEKPAEEKDEPSEERRIKASPAARRLARAHGVDLSEIEGSGPRGRIVKDDVLARVEAQAPAEQEGEPPAVSVPSADLSVEWVDPTSIQRTAAERMSLSFRTAPHFYLSVQVDMSQTVAMRKALLPAVEEEVGVRLSFSDILVSAVARALRDHPALNASFENGRFKRYQEINVGLAVDSPRGLVVPVLHQADRLSLSQLAGHRAEAVKRARNGRMTPEDISGGTFTVSNLGMFGVDLFSAIINPPQAAILAVGRIAKRPVVVADPADELQVRPTMWMSLSVDHRVADGATGARFLQGLVRYLEEPYHLLT